MRLVHILEYVPPTSHAPGHDVEGAEDVEQILEKEIGTLKAGGVSVTTKLLHATVGHAAREIVEAAKEDAADLIIMGSRAGRS